LGTALDDGDKLSCAIDNAGDVITLYYLEATGWQALHGTSTAWSDGGV